MDPSRHSGAQDAGAVAASVAGRVVLELRSRGHRVTSARRAVVEVLAQADGHLSADELCARTSPLLPGVNRATIYRTLETLSDLGVVTHVHLGHGATVHHLASAVAGEDHLHAHCRGCGRIIDLPEDILGVVSDRLAAEHGFRLEPHHVALSGTCRRCDGGDTAPG